MKRILALILALVMCLSLAACSFGGSDDDDDEIECPECGEMNKDSASFCSDCGAELETEDEDNDKKGDRNNLFGDKTDKDSDEDEDEDKDEGKDALKEDKTETAVNTNTGKTAVEEYVEEHHDKLVEEFEYGFESSGLTCDTEIRAEGNGIIFDICVHDFENYTAEQKRLTQQAYDGMSESFEPSLKSIQREIPEVEYLILNICEKDGDFIAAINVGDVK